MQRPDDEKRKFDDLLEDVLSVNKEEIVKREKLYNEAAAMNPKRRGRKRKIK